MPNLPKVTVYSTPTCPYCKMAKDWLKSKEVPFTDIDIAADEKAQKEIIARTGQMAVPVIEIGEALIVGFSPEEMTKLIFG